MKLLPQLLLIIALSMAVTAQSQTTKKATATKTQTPVSKTTVKKTQVKKPVENNAEKTAAIVKAQEDSALAVVALAMQMALEMVSEDSIQRVQIAEQAAVDEKLKQEQLQAEQVKIQAEKNTKIKSKKEIATKSKPEKKEKEPAKKKPEELRATTKPGVANTYPKVYIGLKGSGIGATVIGKDIPDYTKPYIGYGGGLLANFALGKHFSFQPEVLYAQEGFAVNGEDEDGTEVDGSYVLNAIQVPLMLKFSAGKGNRGFFINAGPYASYLLNSQIHDKAMGEEKYTYKPEKTTIEYGLAAGLGVAVPVGKGRLLVEVRGTYYLGATGDEFDLDDVTLVTGALSLGYMFPIGR